MFKLTRRPGLHNKMPTTLIPSGGSLQGGKGLEPVTHFVDSGLKMNDWRMNCRDNGNDRRTSNRG